MHEFPGHAFVDGKHLWSRTRLDRPAEIAPLIELYGEKIAAWLAIYHNTAGGNVESAASGAIFSRAILTRSYLPSLLSETRKRVE